MNYQFLRTYFTQGHQRSITVKKNILFLVFLKGFSLVVTFFMVPLMLHYLSPVKYGIWVTLTSIVGWFSFFDIGLGNGLRNRFVEAQAQGDIPLARTYVSTTYAIIGIVSLSLFVFFLILNPFLNWQHILNTQEIPADDLSYLALVVFFFFCIRFVGDLISVILTADQKPALSSFLSFLGNLLSFLALYAITKISSGNLLLAGTLLSGVPVVILYISSVILYRTRYKNVAPSFSFINLRHLKSLTTLGIQFFIIQISSIILFTTSNIIIAQLFGPETVTPYNIAQRYFGLASMSFTIILLPFWSAFTEAFQKMDYGWMRSMMKKLVKSWLILAVIIFLMILFAPFVYQLWLRSALVISFEINLLVAAFALINTWNNIFANFINGVGKIRLQVVSSVVTGIINIPLSIILAKYFSLGINGVLLSNCLCLGVASVWAPIQYKKIISDTAHGIWNK
ncbi:MAG: MATE family efflux transporter [Bacteroidetes bacterium]|nr:MATE family efflux transporter [Bacteroidota bacterium]